MSPDSVTLLGNHQPEHSAPSLSAEIGKPIQPKQQEAHGSVQAIPLDLCSIQ